MIYNFDDINNEKIYDNCRVMFVTGKYNIFNNIVIDELKSRCQGSKDISIDYDIFDEFGIDANESVRISNSVDINTFMQVVVSPSINGKWFSSVELNTLTKKQTDWIKNYIKSPSENGILVLNSTNYKDYAFWLRNKYIPTDKYVSLIQLSFPRREALKLLVSNLFLKKNVRIEQSALDLFIVRMSTAYDEYPQIIEKICNNNLPDGYLNNDVLENPTITYEQAFESLKGIENFIIDDFINQLVIPMNSDNPRGRPLIFRMMGYLIEEYGARKLVSILLSKINELIEFRMAINTGYIPIVVNYNVDEAKKLIGEDNPISKKSDYQFKKLASLASKTSLLDWVYMKMILQNTNMYNEESFKRVIYSLVTRSVLNESRLNNDISIEDLNTYDIDYIDNIKYHDTGDDIKETRVELWKAKN